MNFSEHTRLFLRLVRLPLSLFVALSAIAGQVLHPAAPDGTGLFKVATGVLLLACGCSALNQAQERRSDALMLRTRNRPLASGRWPVATGLVVAGILLTSGLGILIWTGDCAAPALGLFAVLWYNGVYTPLKRRSAFAVFPGALCGALPPLIGWSAAGGELLDYRVVTLAALFFLWQMPHFWLLLSRHRDDYRRAGLPNLFERFPRRSSFHLIALWIAALATALLLLPGLGMINGGIERTIHLIVVAAIFCLAFFTAHTRDREPPHPLFAGLNLAMAMITLALLTDHLPL